MPTPAPRGPGPADPERSPARRPLAQAPAAAPPAPVPGGSPAGPHALLALQKAAGNRAAAAWLSARPGAATTTPAAPLAPVARAEPLPLAEPLTRARVPVQRAEDEGGLLASVRRRVAGVVDRLRSGWSALSATAGEAFTAVRARAGTAGETLAAAGTALAGGLDTAWDSGRGALAELAAAARRRIGQLVGGVHTAAARLRGSVLELDPDGTQAAWGAVTTAAETAGQGARDAGQAATGRIAGVWAGLCGRFEAGLAAAGGRAGALVGEVRGAAGAVLGRLTGTWQDLTRTAEGLTSGGGGLLGGVVGRVLSAGQGLWNGLAGRWDELRSRADGLAEAVTARAEAAWNGARRLAVSAYEGVRGAWDGARTAAVQGIDRLGGGVRSLTRRIRGFPIGGLAGGLRRYAAPLASVREAVADPTATVEPYADRLAGTVGQGMPAAERAAAEHLAQAPQQSREQVQAADAPSAGPGPAVQRQAAAGAHGDPRSTTGLAEVWAGLRAAWAEKWDQLDLRRLALDTLIGIVWPWPKIGEELTGIGGDVRTAVSSLFAPRNLLADPLGALHDLWTDQNHLLDVPLALWRRLNNIALLLMGPVTIALTVVGACGGSVAGTVLGAIGGALAGLGIGAAPGAAGGFGVGGAAGAGIGFGVAIGLGEAFLASFAAGEAVAFVKALGDLLTTRQTRAEKLRDFGAMADSSLALGITLVLVAVGWLGGRLASAAAGVLRRLVPDSVAEVLDRFARGVRRAREGEPVPEPDENRTVPAEVPGKARLLADIAGSRKFAARIRALLADVQRPGARPRLEARLRALEETLERLNGAAERTADPAEVLRLKAERDVAQGELQRLNADVRAAVPRFPSSWAEFDDRFHEGFEAELRRFRGTEDLEPNPGLRGGEGQLFLGAERFQALKRWFRVRLGDMAESVRLLRGARAGVEADPRLRTVLEVVEVTRVADDWALRGFDPDSVPLRNALADPEVAAARQQAVAALEGATDPTMRLLADKLRDNSANLHWSPNSGRILVIDMQ
ncbi:hypothetical protein [Kitasatospora sp. NPDC004289]